ncbi:MAG: hypothetical protein R3B82_00565 [Sandaracinaceae bacterium]
MSTPIKPPGGPSGPGGPEGPEGSGAVEGSFRAVVDETRASGAGGAEGPAALDALRADVAAGTVSPEAAIEKLVQRAMAGAVGLPDAQRAALESQLREALAGDPTLLALRKDLERAATSKA